MSTTDGPREMREDEIDRYSRQLVLSEVGGAGQARIRSARVLIVGAGGLGSPVAIYLAAAGVGTLGVVDADRVELNNLQRQILHRTDRVDRTKTESARETILGINPDTSVVLHNLRIMAANAKVIISDYDIVVDGSDNFPTRYLLNDACVLLDRPLSSGAVVRFEGQVFTVRPGKSPCYRCLFPAPPQPGTTPTCQEAGVLGAVTGTIGSIQANEVLKLIIGAGEPLLGRLLVFDALAGTFRQIRFARDPDCPICGSHPRVTDLIDYDEFCSRNERN